MMMWWR
jgi:trafficking protein particle complex subunit 12